MSAEPIAVTIGGEQIAVPPIMNFATLERVQPAIDAFNEALRTGDSTKLTAAGLAIIAGSLVEARPELSLGELKKRLRVRYYGDHGEKALTDEGKVIGYRLPPEDGGSERPGVTDAVLALMRQSGLLPAGEVRPPETPAASPSTGT